MKLSTFIVGLLLLSPLATQAQYGYVNGYPNPANDTDYDGMDDLWEFMYSYGGMGQDMIVADGNKDADGDNVAAYWEYKLGIIPVMTDFDADNDGLLDWIEYHFNTSANNPDSNGNGKPDGDEDFDGDGYSNRFELSPLQVLRDPFDPRK